MFKRVDLNIKLQCNGVYFYLENCIQDDWLLFMDHKRDMINNIHIDAFKEDPLYELRDIVLEAKTQMCNDLRVYLNQNTLDKFIKLLQPYLADYLRYKV